MSKYGDWKIILDLPSAQPQLGFEAFSQAFSKIIQSSDARFAIGIFGGWGSGKTTLMNGIQRKLTSLPDENIITVEFSAWRYEKEEHLIIPLLDAIREALVNWGNQKKKISVRRIVENTARVIGGVTESIASGIAIKVGVPNALEFSFDTNKALTTAKEIDRSEELKKVPRSFYYASFAALQSAFQEFSKQAQERRIVVFIDDLDRCLPEGALQVIESMKLFFDLPGFVFVVGLDRRVVEWCIDVNYRKAAGEVTSPDPDTESFRIKGTDYVKKIFQVPFALAPVSMAQIDDYLRTVCNEARVPQEQKEEIENTVKPHLDFLASDAGVNPREVKRYINAYTLTMMTKPEEKEFVPSVVLAILTMAFVPEWQIAYDALLGSRRGFIDALAACIAGDHLALRNFDSSLTGIPSRFLEYVSHGQPGSGLLTCNNIDDYIHLGAGAVDSRSLDEMQDVRSAIGRLRDARRQSLECVSQNGAVDVPAAASASSLIDGISSEFSSLIVGPKQQIIRQMMSSLRDELDVLGDDRIPIDQKGPLDGWQKNINSRFDEILRMLSDYLRETRSM